jgi:hypothetical protein
MFPPMQGMTWSLIFSKAENMTLCIHEERIGYYLREAHIGQKQIISNFNMVEYNLNFNQSLRMQNQVEHKELYCSLGSGLRLDSYWGNLKCKRYAVWWL